MQLSKRLESVSSLVTPGFRVADIGTDHGYIPLWLIRQGVIPGAIAMDIHKGPLQRAKENIRAYELEEKIETRLSDGLGELRPGEADCVVIAGMGGSLVIKILKEGAEVLRTVRELVLQPQSDMEKVRRFLQKEEYRITSEKMILEDGKFYPMMRVVPGENVHSSLKLNVDSFTKNTSVKAAFSENLHADEGAEMPENPAAYTLEEAFGKYLLQEKNPVLFHYLQRESRIRSQILEQLEAAPKAEAVTARILEVKEEAQLIAAALAEYEG